MLSKSKEPLFQKAQEVEIQGFSSVQSRFPQVLWNEGFVDSVAHLRKPQETTDGGVEGWTSCVQRSQRKDLSYQNNEIFATSLKAKLWLTTGKCCGCKWLSLFKSLFSFRYQLIPMPGQFFHGVFMEKDIGLRSKNMPRACLCPTQTSSDKKAIGMT